MLCNDDKELVKKCLNYEVSIIDFEAGSWGRH